MEAVRREAQHHSWGTMMSQVSKFLFILNDTAQGVHHVLPSGVALRVFFGEHVMLSVVDMGAEKYAPPHSHAEEQWGLCLEGSAVRIQGGEEFAVGPGDFWYTPGNMPHAIRSGPNGIRILDIFGPPREKYKIPPAEQAG